MLLQLGQGFNPWLGIDALGVDLKRPPPPKKKPLQPQLLFLFDGAALDSAVFDGEKGRAGVPIMA